MHLSLEEKRKDAKRYFKSNNEQYIRNKRQSKVKSTDIKIILL